MLTRLLSRMVKILLQKELKMLKKAQLQVRMLNSKKKHQVKKAVKSHRFQHLALKAKYIKT